jgi:hypothetical protein
MKKLRILLLGAVGAVALAMGPSAQAAPGLLGSAHDFSTNSWNTRKTACGVCHTVHHTDASKTAPLWAHETTTSAFTPYSSATLTATVGQPGSASKACLSCHDGTVAINQYGGSLKGTAEYVEGTAVIGTDLSITHPISFTFDSALATTDGGLNDPATTTVAQLGGKTIQESMLFNGKMECASCHDIHRQKGNSMNSGIFTVIGGSSQVASALCLTCHKK